MKRASVWCFALIVAISIPRFARSTELLPADKPIQEVIDFYVDLKLAEEGVRAAPLADDANIVRRTTLDLVGRIPTVVESKAYLEASSDNRRQELVDRLTTSPAFVRHQVNEFDTLLMDGTGRSLRDYLQKALQEKRPWDQMFRELLIGEESDPEQKGAAQFVKARVKDLDKLSNQASVIFFGVNVSCAQCHDHPLVPDWTQEHFFGMKSYFSRTFENGDFIAERDYGLVKYKTTGGEERTAKLMFLTGTVIDEPESKEPSDEEKKKEKKTLEELKKKKQAPPPPVYSRRAQLVDVALRPEENQYFAKAIVNRIWYRLFGYGLVMPIDQMHPENTPSHPELLEWLARDIVAHGYDLTRLVRGIVLTHAYARTSLWESEERPRKRYFAVANARPLSPHQYASSLRVASMNPDVYSADMKAEDFEKRIEGIERSARGLAGLFDQPRNDFQVSVTEALLFNNSERIVNDLLRDAGDSLLGKAKSIEDTNEIINVVALNVLCREPKQDEVELMSKFLKEREDRKAEGIRQIIWALLASSECRFNY